MVFGLLGPNGAGKTTLVRILATLPRAGRGQAELLGLDVVADSSKVRDSRSRQTRPARRALRDALPA